MIKQIGLVLLLLILFAIPSFANTLPLLTKKYERIAGKPDVFKDSFPVCNTGASYSLVVQNGNAGKNRVSAASIVVNGAEVVKGNEFNQKIDRIEKKVTLLSENTLEVKLKSIPGNFITVNLICTANCLDVRVATPTNGSIITKQKTIIKGTLYNAYGETGVTVGNTVSEGSARFSAYREGSAFAGIVQLAPGGNRITATATDACGQKAEDIVIVNAVPSAETVRFTVNPSSGAVSSQTGTMDVKFEADVYGEALNYAWDFDGDGTVDKSGSDASSVTFGYSQSGLYFPTVTVTDSKGNAYGDTAVVSVMSLEEMNALLKGKWDGMREGLKAGDVEKALRYFTEEAKGKYQYNFNLMSNLLPSIANDMRDITFVKMIGDMAEYNMTAAQGGKTRSFYVEFVRDIDGIWRIRFY